MPEPRSAAATKFGERIRAEREKQGATQEEIAHIAGMNVANYGKIERGLGNPRFDTIIRLASVLSIDPCELLDGITAKDLPPLKPILTVRDWVADKSNQAESS